MRNVAGFLFVLAGLAVIGGLAAAYLSWAPAPAFIGMLGAFVLAGLACAVTFLEGLAADGGRR